MEPPPFLKQVLSESMSNVESDLGVLEYNPSFTLRDIALRVGDVVVVYIPERYFTVDKLPILSQKVTGTTIYSPDSDICGICIHSGSLFLNTDVKSKYARRFCTINNTFEILGYSESEWSKVSDVVHFPLDLMITGVILTLYIDDSPKTFTGCKRNGIVSKESQVPEQYAIRVTQKSILTIYDPEPTIVPISEYIPEHVTIPRFKLTFTADIGIEYNPFIFTQIFSRDNVFKGLLKSYKLCFDSNRVRYEIQCPEGEDTFDVMKHESGEVVAIGVPMIDFKVTQRSIIIQKTRIQDVDSIVLIRVKNNRAKARALDEM